MKRSIEKKNNPALRAVVIGASAGGLNALKAILSPLPKTFFLPIIIVQHIHPEGTSFVDALSVRCSLKIREAIDKDKLTQGVVYLAPPDYHLLVEDEETLTLSTDERVNYARPSIDVLFESASDVFKERLIGIVLTGANNDGAQGLKYVKGNGGIAVVQDPKTAEMPTMPQAAITKSTVDHVLGLEGIAQFLIGISEQAPRDTEKQP